ncbi:hypothetical protein Y032_0058g2860 [Ancylostoma ceylanicum]|nr:hypothetical protein Y032_0058g2860 [Ancylostoma ceylanicum]
MSFHTPVKALNPVDTKLPDHVVKGAVIVDELIGKWNANVVLEANGPMSAFIVIDKKLQLMRKLRQERKPNSVMRKQLERETIFIHLLSYYPH